MKKFDVEITETLQRKVSVEAASQEDAERMVTQAWNNQDYVLDSGDFTGVDFKTVGEHELAETRTMDVLLVQPNAYPKKISVGTELEDLQAMVGGDIEVTYPFEDRIIAENASEGEVEHLLDYMLDVCCDDRMLNLFKKVCRRYYSLYPEMIASEILAYKEWYED